MERPSLRWRLAIATLIGVGSGMVCCFFMRRFHQDAADFRWAIRLARNLANGQTPYDTPLEQYPVTAAVLARPFLSWPPEAAAGFFYGASSFLLALGMSRYGYHRLLVFLAYPYWAGLFVVQWSTLITAGALFPLLLPVTLAKPQIGLPVLATHATRRGLLACVLLFMLTLVWLPSWPILWAHQWRNYEHFIPLLVFPGPLLLLALWRYRERDAWLLLLASAMPQRWFFDSFTLWLIPKTRKQILFTVFFSWWVGIWRWNQIPHSFTAVGRGAVIFLYLPMLAVILWRSGTNDSRANSLLTSAPNSQLFSR